MPLTDTRLRNLKPNGKRMELPDRDGLSLRVSQRGVMTWSLTYRVQGAGEADGSRVDKLASEKRRIKLGEYPGVSLSEARERAIVIKRTARLGTDPEAKPAQPEAVSVGDLINRYSSEHLGRGLRAGSNVQKLLQLHVVPRWGEKELAAITRRDFVQILEEVRTPTPKRITLGSSQYDAVRGGPGAASEVRKWVRAMFGFAVDIGLLDANPLTDVRNRDRQQSRHRVLSMSELRTITAASEKIGPPWDSYFKLLILTGNRRGEWAGARADWLDSEVTRLEIPASNYKTGKPHVVPLSLQTQAVLCGLPKPEHGPYLISSTGGLRPISGFSKAKANLDALITSMQGKALEPWVVHDIRRSMATHMERIGIEPHIIELCLGHSLKGVAATYRRYSYFEEKRLALNIWADEVSGIERPLSNRRPLV